MTHVHLVPMCTMSALYMHAPIRLHGMVPSMGATLPFSFYQGCSVPFNFITKYVFLICYCFTSSVSFGVGGKGIVVTINKHVSSSGMCLACLWKEHGSKFV